MSELKLPTSLTAPVDSISELVFLIYGERKIGKTSLCAQFEDSIFLFFEPGGKGLSTYQLDIANWRDFQAAVRLLTDPDNKDAARFKTIIIDTVDICYDRCLDFVCKKEGISHPSDSAYGKGWKAVESEFKLQFSRLMLSGKGVVLTSHAEAKTFTGRRGNEFSKLAPTMSGQSRKYVIGAADIMGYYGYYKNERYLVIAGDEDLDAGHRLSDYFRTPDGERVKAIPMGNSAEEAYSNIVRAFQNKQTDIHDLEKKDQDKLEKSAMGKR